MRALTTAGRVAVLAAALPLVGCAASLGGYDLAPSGLTRAEDALRRDLALDPVRAYSTCVEGSEALPEDDLLRLMFAGAAGRYAGAHAQAGRLLDVAAYVADDRVTTSVSRQALSMVTSDRALAYVPGRTERIMIHYTAATAFLAAGDPTGAAVEARRIEALLDRLGEAGDGHDVSDDARFLHLFAASVFEAAGEPSAAEVAYRRAGRADPVAAGPEPEAAVSDSVDVADSVGMDTAHLPDRADVAETGEVVVLVERGFVPHRVEQSVAIVVPPRKVAAMTDGDFGDATAAAADAALHILAYAGRLRGGRAYYHDHGYRDGLRLDPWSCDRGCGNGDGESDADPYLLRVSWPVLYREPVADGPVVVRAGDMEGDAVARLDVGDGVRRDFEADRGAIVARTVARAASKLALSATARSAVSEKDETAGRVVGFLANLGTALTERADTRSWHLLPGSVSMVRLRLPAGTHEVTLDDGGRAVPLGTVDVRPGRVSVLAHRTWR